jgi:succinyl-CoA synthetase alpha subunit
MVLIGEIGGTRGSGSRRVHQTWKKKKKPVAASLPARLHLRDAASAMPGPSSPAAPRQQTPRKKPCASAGVEVSDTIIDIGEAMKKALVRPETGSIWQQMV